MKQLILIVAAALALAGCQTDQQVALPPVTVTGPTFAVTAFDCGVRPLEPDLTNVDPAKQGSVVLRYQEALATWGQRCQNRLTAMKQPLVAAGQVAGE